MFDVRPTGSDGSLDLEKIRRSEKILSLKERQAEKIKKAKLVQLGNVFPAEEVPFIHRFDQEEFERQTGWKRKGEKTFSNRFSEKKRIRIVSDWKAAFRLKESSFQFVAVCLSVLVIVFAANFIGKGLGVKERSLLGGETALAELNEAKKKILENDFRGSIYNLEESEKEFAKISADLDELGLMLSEAGRIIPLASKITSGKYLAEAGKKVSEAGIVISGLLESLEGIKNPIEENGISFLEVFRRTDETLKQVSGLAEGIEKDLQNISLDDLPEDKREKFTLLKNELPGIRRSLQGFISDSQIMYDILGGNGPRKYLFLFQNNNEMRATGGFIGTYALLDIFDGRIRRLKVDGIFNPDGQLKEKVIPPAPIQKISAAWSLHDSNWWPDFPTSAEKAAWFWEKTGGPTVDGVIAMTPVVLGNLLEITGPIEMEEYGKVISRENFMAEVQKEVEEDYDKDLNQPKKILADLTPKILDRIFNIRDPKDLLKVLKVLNGSLDEKHMLLYSTNLNVEKIISDKGWSGEILDTRKDYLSVINSNINGYKTDGVVKEKIEHKTEIQEDGRVINEVSITRKHEGGNSEWEWFNKVNANYQRVYVPRGSRLISVSGQTREFNDPPLDYKALKFKLDPQVAMEEQDMQIDSESGTRIYEEKNKTVFANWVYVSPQEEVRVIYRYELPFRIEPEGKGSGVNTYSILFQKQSGSLGSEIYSEIVYPEKVRVIWRYPESDFKKESSILKFSGILDRDKFLGLTLGR